MPYQAEKKVDERKRFDWSKPPAVTLNMLKKIHERKQELAKEKLELLELRKEKEKLAAEKAILMKQKEKKGTYKERSFIGKAKICEEKSHRKHGKDGRQ